MGILESSAFSRIIRVSWAFEKGNLRDWPHWTHLLPPLALRRAKKPYLLMAGTISVSMSTFRSNFKVKHSLLGS